MSNLEELRSLLDTPKSIIITTHRKPDGDALGSSLGLYHYLLKKGHTVNIVTPTDYPFYLNWLPGENSIIDYKNKDNNKSVTHQLIKEADIIFCLDFNNINRIDGLEPFVKNANAKKVLIDHHPDAEDFTDFRYYDDTASSTAELIYDFISDFNEDKELIDKNIAVCLYVGIMTDTGSFRFSCTTAKVHLIVADLASKGIDVSDVYDKIYDNFPESRIRFMGHCIKEKLTILPEYHTGLISVSREELNEYEIKTGDTEGLVNYPLAIKGIKLATLIIDRTDIVKLSFRSKGDFPANLIAKNHFEGGGHINAAGGHSELSLEETVEKFVSILPEYHDLLT